MGSFSWKKADNLTRVANVVNNKPFKFLIPKEFGGGFIKDNYQDYGLLGTKEDGSSKYDMYELLACWNEPDKIRKNIKVNYSLKEMDKNTNYNREIGIDIGCYDEDIDKLKYPLKLVSCSYKGTYEDLESKSYNDPNQGFSPLKREQQILI